MSRAGKESGFLLALSERLCDQRDASALSFVLELESGM